MLKTSRMAVYLPEGPTERQTRQIQNVFVGFQSKEKEESPKTRIANKGHVMLYVTTAGQIVRTRTHQRKVAASLCRRKDTAWPASRMECKKAQKKHRRASAQSRADRVNSQKNLRDPRRQSGVFVLPRTHSRPIIICSKYLYEIMLTDCHEGGSKRRKKRRTFQKI